MKKDLPLQVRNRITSLDLLRGFALLGILIMNITSFSNIGVGYINPTVGAGLDGYNAWIFNFSYIFADMRFMSLFSILFGAGLILFTDNLVKKGKKVWPYQLKRMASLFVFGMIHAYLIWMGDILVAYAICGSIVFFMRAMKVRTLIIFSVVFFILPIIFSASALLAPADMMEQAYSFFYPTELHVAQEIAAYRGSYPEQMPFRIEGAIELQTLLFIMEQMWHVLSMMLLGMILYKLEVLTAARTKKYYKKMLLIGFGLGLPIASISLYFSFLGNWDSVMVMSAWHPVNYIASVFVALGYIALLMLWSKSNVLSSFSNRLQAVGRMAFTNYILTSIICTTIFYGHGFGMFAKLDRLEQWGVVLLIWIILLVISPIVLNRFKRGPLEDLWRRITYA